VVTIYCVVSHCASSCNVEEAGGVKDIRVQCTRKYCLCCAVFYCHLMVTVHCSLVKSLRVCPSAASHLRSLALSVGWQVVTLGRRPDHPQCPLHSEILVGGVAASAPGWCSGQSATCVEASCVRSF